MTTENYRFGILLAEVEPADAHVIKVAIAENHILTNLHHVLDGRETLDYLQHLLFDLQRYLVIDRALGTLQWIDTRGFATRAVDGCSMWFELPQVESAP